MKQIKKISLKELSDPLSEKELKALKGGYDSACTTSQCDTMGSCTNINGVVGKCGYIPLWMSCKCIINW